MHKSLDPLKLFKDVSVRSPVMVAVSGGSDSIALLLLASAWANHRNVSLHVVTVDHGLRPEAAAEAAFVAGVSEALGHPHITLAWDGIKPASGISSAARDARYGLMAEFALDTGIETILTGHTLNDQAETILMRNERDGASSQSRGLSGMAKEVQLAENLVLKRPLLGLRRKDLRGLLHDNQQSWIEDPTNDDASYERVRVRRRINDDDGLISHLSRFGEINARERRLVCKAAAVFLKDPKNLRVNEGPVFEVAGKAVEALPVPVRLLSIQILIAAAGGAEYFVPSNRVLTFFENTEEKRITIGNAVLERRSDGLRIYREKRNLPSILVPPGEEMLWDGRLAITNNSATTFYCGSLDGTRRLDAERLLGRKLMVAPKAALDSTPYLCGDGDDLYLPFVRGFERPLGLEVKHVVRAIEHFCPEFDYPLLAVVNQINSRILGAKQNNP